MLTEQILVYASYAQYAHQNKNNGKASNAQLLTNLYYYIGCDFPFVFQLPSHSIQVWLALDIIKTRDDKTADTMTTDMNP